jgi:hypothetical protein
MIEIIIAAFTVLSPPQQYNHSFHGKIVVNRDMSICPRNALACTVVGYGSGTCVIHTRHMDRKIIRHEIAHCNGWPSWHPTAIQDLADQYNITQSLVSGQR